MGSLFLFAAAFFWGTTFVAQKVGGGLVGPFTYLALRSLVGCAFLFPIQMVFSRMRGDGPLRKDKKAIKAGAVIGLFLFAASFSQQWGIAYTTAGKAGFITAIYIILVPLAEFLIFRKKYSAWGIVSVGIAILGFYLLCMGGEMDLNRGDLLVLISAFLYTAEILAIDRLAGECNGGRVSFLQFFVLTILSFPGMLILERPSMGMILEALPSILYAGILSSGVAYTCQILGQRTTPPLIATLIMSLESVFSVLFGFFLLGETMSPREMLGCAVVFSGALLAQFKGRGKEHMEKESEKKHSEKAAPSRQKRLAA